MPRQSRGQGLRPFEAETRVQIPVGAYEFNFDAQFENYIKKVFSGKKIKFNQVESFTDNGLLVVDFVAWSVHRKWNLNDDFYFNIIRDKIVNKDNIELWKNKS